jgi:hypothetical protein
MEQKRGRGRPKGSLSKVTKAVREVAQEYTDEALGVLAAIMRNEAEPAAARVSAVKEILDRGHGKSTQPVDLDARLQATFRQIELVPVKAGDA